MPVSYTFGIPSPSESRVSLWQVAEQPSPETRFPSSHCSVPSVTPLPQTGEAGTGERYLEEPRRRVGVAGPERGLVLRVAADLADGAPGAPSTAKALHDPSGTGVGPVRTASTRLVEAGVALLHCAVPQLEAAPASPIRDVNVPAAT